MWLLYGLCRQYQLFRQTWLCIHPLVSKNEMERSCKLCAFKLKLCMNKKTSVNFVQCILLVLRKWIVMDAGIACIISSYIINIVSHHCITHSFHLRMSLGSIYNLQLSWSVIISLNVSNVNIYFVAVMIVNVDGHRRKSK